MYIYIYIYNVFTKQFFTSPVHEMFMYWRRNDIGRGVYNCFMGKYTPFRLLSIMASNFALINFNIFLSSPLKGINQIMTIFSFIVIMTYYLFFIWGFNKSSLIKFDFFTSNISPLIKNNSKNYVIFKQSSAGKAAARECQ